MVESRLIAWLCILFILILNPGQEVLGWSPVTRIRRPISILSAVPAEGPGISIARNVLGGDLECCCADVGGSGIGTGFYRDGHCSTGVQDQGVHTVCIEASAEFLAYSKAVGNDLSTPIPEYAFPGVRPGDRWCLCALRWAQAYNARKAPPLYLRATHEKTLDTVPLEILKEFALDAEEATAYTSRLDAMRTALEGSLRSPPSA